MKSLVILALLLASAPSLAAVCTADEVRELIPRVKTRILDPERDFVTGLAYDFLGFAEGAIERGQMNCQKVTATPDRNASVLETLYMFSTGSRIYEVNTSRAMQPGSLTHLVSFRLSENRLSPPLHGGDNGDEEEEDSVNRCGPDSPAGLRCAPPITIPENDTFFATHNPGLIYDSLNSDPPNYANACDSNDALKEAYDRSYTEDGIPLFQFNWALRNLGFMKQDILDLKDICDVHRESDFANAGKALEEMKTLAENLISSSALEGITQPTQPR